MFRLGLTLCLCLAACTSRRPLAPPPQTRWVVGLSGPATSEPGTTAIVYDVERSQQLGLGGKMETWMRWADERARNAAIEALPNSGTPALVLVKARLGGQLETPCSIDLTAFESTVPRSLLDPNDPARPDRLTLPVQLGALELGATEFIVRDGPACVLGRDLFSRAVLIVPQHGRQPVWLMVLP